MVQLLFSVQGNTGLILCNINNNCILMILNIIFNNDNYSASNQHIRVISEGSCDTEDWSNVAENSALDHRNK